MPATPQAGSTGGRFWPAMPAAQEDLDIPAALVTDLVLRRLQVDGSGSLSGLRRELKLSVQIVEGVCRHLMQQRLAENRGMAGADYVFGLTTAGRQLAMDRMQACHYAGPAPVSLRSYETAVRSQRPRVRLNRQKLAASFADLVLTSRFLDFLGPALQAQKSIFLYGPTGNGKTSVAERMARIYDDRVLVPYAVEVDGQIVCVHDPVVHQNDGFEPETLDPRWVLCSRPLVVTGGELTTQQLDLQMDAVSKIYAAPVQMKTNNGVLVIDDFGRQAMSPQNLLNRWICPLDRRVDYLSLSYGLKFAIPFEVLVVFSTNLEVRSLADDAFLRRLPHKIYVGPPSEEQFREIFRRVAQERGLTFDQEIPERLAELCRSRGGPTSLNACLSRDICEILMNIQDYEERAYALSQSDLERAVELYFPAEK